MGTAAEIPPSRDDRYMIWEAKNLTLTTRQLSKTEIIAHTGDLSSHHFPFPRKSAEKLAQTQTRGRVLDAPWCPLDWCTAWAGSSQGGGTGTVCLHSSGFQPCKVAGVHRDILEAWFIERDNIFYLDWYSLKETERHALSLKNLFVLLSNYASWVNKRYSLPIKLGLYVCVLDNNDYRNPTTVYFNHSEMAQGPSSLVWEVNFFFNLHRLRGSIPPLPRLLVLLIKLYSMQMTPVCTIFLLTKINRIFPYFWT